MVDRSERCGSLCDSTTTFGECPLGAIEGYVSSAVKHARVKQGRVLVVPQLYRGVGVGCFSTPLSLPLLLPALSLSLSSLAPSHGCGRCMSRVAPVPPAVAYALPWALVVQGAPFCVGASTPVRLVGMGCLCAPCASSALTSCRGPGGV
jgi:hypothetical protein